MSVSGDRPQPGTIPPTLAGGPVDAPPDSKAALPRWFPRAILLVVLAFLGILAVLGLLERLQGLIFLLVVSLFLSFALEPAVNWLAARGWRRGLATGAVLFGLFVLGVVLVASMVPLVVEQIRGLVADVPGWLDRVNRYTERWFDITVSTDNLREQLGNVDASLTDFAGNVAGNLLGFGAAVVSAIFQLLTVALFTFYLVAEGPAVRRAVCSLMRPERQREVLWAWDIAIEKTGGYLYSRLLLATISGAVTFVVLTMLGVPFSAPLALWVGVVSQFVPVIGTYIAMVLPLLVALLDSVPAAIGVVIFFVVYQQIENYILSPRITAHTMALHPAVAFGAVIAGGSLYGPVGAFLSLPAAAILQAGLSSYITRHEVMDSELTRDDPPPAVVRAAKAVRGDPLWRRRLVRRSRDPTPAPSEGGDPPPG
jgi:predicted PurR-regulated permease PerM